MYPCLVDAPIMLESTARPNTSFWIDAYHPASASHSWPEQWLKQSLPFTGSPSLLSTWNNTHLASRKVLVLNLVPTIDLMSSLHPKAVHLAESSLRKPKQLLTQQRRL